MTLNIQLAPRAESRLTDKAREAGGDVAEYATRLLESEALRPTLREISGPIHEAFEASGMTEEELGDLLEKAKHEMREERRTRKSS